MQFPKRPGDLRTEKMSERFTVSLTGHSSSGDDIQITPAQPDDLDAILEIEKGSFSDPWSRQGFEDALKYEYSALFAARVHDQVAGYCCLYHIMDEGEIVNVAVAEAFRSRGIGKRMLKEMLRFGMSKGVKRFILDVRVGNAPAIKLYRKMGFCPLVLEKNFYESPLEDAWLMELKV